MDQTEAERSLLKAGIRVGPEMARYVCRKAAEERRTFPVIGRDARTGVPVRPMVDRNMLRGGEADRAV